MYESEFKSSVGRCLNLNQGEPIAQTTNEEACNLVEPNCIDFERGGQPDYKKLTYLVELKSPCLLY